MCLLLETNYSNYKLDVATGERKIFWRSFGAEFGERQNSTSILYGDVGRTGSALPVTQEDARQCLLKLNISKALVCIIYHHFHHAPTPSKEKKNLKELQLSTHYQ